MQQKQTFKLILAGLTILLLILPVITTFNSVLTSLINRIGIYRALQDLIVPFESRFVIVIVKTLGVSAYLAPVGDQASFYILKAKEYFPVQLQWNCLGWQSLILLIISLAVGLRGDFKLISKLECMTLGIVGTFLVNIFRMVFITLGIYFIDTVFALLIHDYFAALTTIIWLLFFWWFSYSYILEERE
jgi:exosortase/archaeosortase family protein